MAYVWEWSENIEDAGSLEESMSTSPAISEESSQIETSHVAANGVDDCSIPAITHIVTFKCIGATRDAQHQDALLKAQ